jgi:hypothetical protein
MKETGLEEQVERQVRGGTVVPGRPPRTGWAEAARRLRELGEDRLLDKPASTRFDEKEWRWRTSAPSSRLPHGGRMRRTRSTKARRRGPPR